MALDKFLGFEHPDAWSRRERWRAPLQQPLPEHGAGIDAVLRSGADLVR